MQRPRPGAAALAASVRGIGPLSAALLLLGCAHPAARVQTAGARDLSGQPAALARPGQVVLVDFWATWCEPCRVALPIYAQLYRELRGRGLEVIAVSVDDGDAEVVQFLKAAPLPFTVLRDPGGALAESLGVEQMPTSLLVGRDGRERARRSGFAPGSEQALRAQLEVLLAER
jgi:cytochrome c biogenesis protein CcmG/thiol:disulfide interchange protein DsbE